MDSRLFVGNLSYSTTEEQLRTLFSQAGTIKELSVITDRATGRPKGFGFVEMATQADAQKAIDMFHDYELDNRRLTVNLAKPRPERGTSDYRGGSRSGFGRSSGGREARSGY